MVFGLVILKWISPENMGLWNGVTIATPYIGLLQLGVFLALNRELPYLIGKKKKEEAIENVQTVAFYSNLVSLIILIITSGFYLFYYFSSENDLYLFTIICFGISVALKAKQNYLVVTFRSHEDFKKLGYIYFGNIPVFAFAIILVIMYGYNGFLAGQILIPLILTASLYFKRPYKVRSTFFKKRFAKLLKTGIPFFVINYFHGLSPSFKKIALLSYLGSNALGLFSPGLAILAAGRFLPKIIGSFVYPKMSKKYGETDSKKSIWRMNLKSAIVAMFLAIPPAVLLYFSLPWLFDTFFPKYSEALDASSIVLISTVIAIPQMMYNGLNSVKSYKSMILTVILRLLIYWFVMIGVYHQIGGIIGLAWGIVASDLIYTISVMVVTYYTLKLKQ